MSSDDDARRAEFGWPGGDRPGELRFEHALTPGVEEALGLAVAGSVGPVGEARALTPPDGAIGRYAVAGVDGRQWFVRVSARWGEPELEQAITGWLRDHGLAVNHLEAAGLRMEWRGRSLRVDVRERLQGRHFNGSLDDLASLAALLARCHLLLRSFPGAPRVRELTEARFAGLEAIRARMREALATGRHDYFCQEPEWAMRNAGWLGELVARFEPRCDLLREAQCLHGQVHQANVLYAPGPVLVDWEEAVQSHSPPAWDLASFVQRFCLHDAPGAEAARARLAIVREAYGAPLGDLAGMMRHTAWLSMVILCGYRERGIENPVAEYDKFVRLEEQARALGPLLGEFAA